MEAEDDEEVNDSNERCDESSEVWDCVGGGGGGDEGGGDEQLFQISRLQQHATSETSFNRQMVGRILVEMFRAAVNNKLTLVVEEVMQHVQLIIDDNDALVRSDLVEQIPNVANICLEAPDLFGDVLRDHLLGIIIKYLSDPDNQVRQMAQNALMTIVKRGLLDNNTIEHEICPTIEHLSYISADEHLRNANISLMCRLAPLIGSELTEKVFLRQYLDLCESNDMMVRRTCATHFGDMCVAVGKEKLYSKLIPTFVDLCGDRVWGVRKACVEVMMPVACCSTPEQRRLLLADILAKHLNDDSKWVRISAFQILGPFISTFAKQFADVTYNKHGELVYTSKQDNHFSICYSYEGIFPTKSAMKNQMSDMDDNSKSLIYLPLPLNVRHDNVKTADSSEGNDSQKKEENPNCYLPLRFVSKFQAMRKKRKPFPLLKTDMDDTENYNPFLYYYIPPDIILDDELTHAARQSAMNRSNANKKKALERLIFRRKVVYNETHTFPNLSDEENSNTDGQSDVDKLDNRKEETDDDDDGDCLPLLQNTTESLDDSPDLRTNLWAQYYNTLCHIDSMDKSDESCDFSKNLDAKDNGQQIVPQELINYYVSMADPEQCVDMGAEIPHHCAFSFPAVTLTLGTENWHYLKKAYQSLSSAKHWKVRHTLASSIHEIAIILGEELTATDLVPIYDGFIKDLDEVRIGVLKHLATFLKILKPSDRCQYLPRLSDFLATDNEWNWRFREELATQLLEIVTLFNANDVAQSIAPLSFQLLIDKVAAVRNVALELITRIMCYLSTDDALVTSLIHELRDTLVFNAKKWIHRQIYALVCSHLIRNNAITGSKFSKEMLPCLINLSVDRVPNVRLAVARTLATDVIGMGLDTLGMEAMEEVERMLTKMRIDADRDVRVFAGGEEQLDVLAYCSSDENNQVEHAKHILF
ncbi:serine/threonine-protein phosphatase 4 regulatory subunit 1-like isoform X3 [Cataglyphis hispanica]|nr:serine/threonine-protein phosphatase 4 regulatory subunit 1-like isoform X3 [Cataglyphis hispanica]XP_050459180.1 serine/threonine-protein phosphatase 4 regulatory subunit 1-like isoform X3 [Cataglyphis hispanica]XP_050459181.1 serine/threonine-protein phosphatase 4 regulatory subunit 1-like isoform X3 [Cataglyphis hispanica]